MQNNGDISRATFRWDNDQDDDQDDDHDDNVRFVLDQHVLLKF